MTEVEKAAEAARFKWLGEILKPNTSCTVTMQGAFGIGFLAGAKWQREHDVKEQDG